MKRVIRKGVFETNSSSTHSISYTPGVDEDDNVGFTFECRTPAARLLMIKAQVNHCLEDLQYVEESHDYIVLVKSFYDVCVELYCERQGVDPDTIEDHLYDFAASTFYGGIQDRFREHFKEYYHEESCELCETFFENGPLIECNCLYFSVTLFLSEFFKDGSDRDAMRAKAVQLLYEGKPFLCSEFYSGVYLIDSEASY